MSTYGLAMSSPGSFPDGRLVYPGQPVPLPQEGPVRLKMEVRGAGLQYFYAPGIGGNWQPIGPVLDASLISDECGGHAEHGSFTGGFTGVACSDLNGTALVLYAAITNVILMTLYSANNTPYSAMTAVMTGDGHERTILSSYRFFSAMIAQLIVGGFTLPLVAKFGEGDAAKGWQMTMGLWAVVCVVLFVITFLTTRERIQPPPTQTSSRTSTPPA